MTTPNALKSFVLKFVELLHSIDLLLHAQEPQQSAIKSFFGRAVGGRSTVADDTQVRIRDLQSQASEAVRVLNLWQGSHLLMDEVDLILHPLKSELNYPIGPREPLDLTDNRAGKGLRWEIPFALLDVLGVVTSSSPSATSAGVRFGMFKESRQMAVILDKLKGAIKQGQADRSVQRVPHFILLRKSFYTAYLLPLLAEWMLIWLGSKGLSGLTDHQVLEFLKKGPRDPAAAKSVDGCASLTGEYVKMLNLTHDWLTSLLPHCLTKVHRVGFGMLSWEEIEEIKKTQPYLPKVSSNNARDPMIFASFALFLTFISPLVFSLSFFQSRIYTAVPFVGKGLNNSSHRTRLGRARSHLEAHICLVA